MLTEKNKIVTIGSNAYGKKQDRNDWIQCLRKKTETVTIESNTYGKNKRRNDWIQYYGKENETVTIGSNAYGKEIKNVTIGSVLTGNKTKS